MRRNPRRKSRAITASLYNTSHESRAVQLAHLLRHANVLVDQRLVVRDHILLGRVRVVALLERVRGPREQVFPEDCGNELQERDNVEGAELRAWLFAVEEEVEELEADGMALGV